MRVLNILFGTLCFQGGSGDLSFLRGKWKGLMNQNDSSYFHVKDNSIYAIRENAKLSMDIKFVKKQNDVLHLNLNNLKIHSVPVMLSVFDYRVVNFVRRLMKHGMTLEFSTLPNTTLVVSWKIHHSEDNKVIQEGEVMLSQFSRDNQDE
jgi:hypothetical protein